MPEEIFRQRPCRRPFSIFCHADFNTFQVIPLSLGLCVSVVDEWSKSPATFTVCQNHFVASRLQQLFKEHDAALHKKEFTDVSYCITTARHLIQSDIVPEKFEALIDWIQRLNTSFRWMVLHTGKKK